MDYIPFKDSDRILWNENLNSKIDALAAELDLDATEVATLKSVSAANAAAIKACDQARVASRAATAAKVTQLKTGNAVLRGIVRKIKSSSNYTTAIGTTLDIIGDDTTPMDYSSYHPTIKAHVFPGKVRISFVKNGLDGMNFYSRQKGQTAWEKLDYCGYSPYEDRRPLATPPAPEHRELMAIGVLRDKEVTLQSAIIEAVFGG